MYHYNFLIVLNKAAEVFCSWFVYVHCLSLSVQVTVSQTYTPFKIYCVVYTYMHDMYDEKLKTLQHRGFYIVLMPKDPVVLLLKSLEHSVRDALVPHPAMR